MDWTQALNVMQAMIIFALLSTFSVVPDWCDRNYPREVDEHGSILSDFTVPKDLLIQPHPLKHVKLGRFQCPEEARQHM